MDHKTTIQIGGMSCGHCVASVKSALSGIEGVQVEQVRVGQASVAYDSNRTSLDRITQAIADEGYSVVSTN